MRLTDAAGRVAWEAAYAPFGEARLTAAEVSQPWRRPGQYADAETGLCYNRLRYYDPALGRYLTPDPAGLLGGAHAYRDARSGPTWDADPLGLWRSWRTIAAGVAAVAAVGGGSGAISYTTNWALNGADPKQWSWTGFAGSVAFGAVTAPSPNRSWIRGTSFLSRAAPYTSSYIEH